MSYDDSDALVFQVETVGAAGAGRLEVDESPGQETGHHTENCGRYDVAMDQAGPVDSRPHQRGQQDAGQAKGALEDGDIPAESAIRVVGWVFLFRRRMQALVAAVERHQTGRDGGDDGEACARH